MFAPKTTSSEGQLRNRPETASPWRRRFRRTGGSTLAALVV
jgi:hypothetical protein